MRSNAVYMLLTLCAGELLAGLLAKDLTNIINSIIALNVPLYTIVEIVLLVMTPVIVLFTFKKAVSSSKLLLQLIPAAASTIIAFILIVAKLPYDLQAQIKDTDIYFLANTYYAVAITAGLLTSMFYLWTKRPDKFDKKAHK